MRCLNFFYISCTIRYRPDLTSAVSFTSWHIIAPHRVLLVSVCRSPAVFYRMGTHSVFPTVMCKITVDLTTTSSKPITVVFCTASSSTALIWLVTVVSSSSIFLTAYIVLTCILRWCSILHLHCPSTLVVLSGIDPTWQVQFRSLPDILLHHTAYFWCLSAVVLQYFIGWAHILCFQQ